MKTTETSFEGLIVFEPSVFRDDRGYFFESYNENVFKSAGLNIRFVQDNQSYSARGVLRGLHFQKPPFAQSKLVHVLQGVVQDVAVDLRPSSRTFGKHYSIELSASNKKQIFIPKGFAHGFLVLSDAADVLYKCDEYYHPEAEGGLIYNDPFIKVSWDIKNASPILSPKDLKLPDWSLVKDIF